MRLKAKNLTPVFAALWVCVAVFAIWQTSLRDNDVASAIGAGLLLLTSLFYARYVLLSHLQAPPLIYLVASAFSPGSPFLPWALGIYDISRALSSPLTAYRMLFPHRLLYRRFHIGTIVALSRADDALASQR